MGKASVPALDAGDLVPREGPKGRERFKAALQRRYSPRVHMSLILSASGLSAMLASWYLLHLGVHWMLVRYPVAIILAYAVFLLGVWTWLRMMGFIDGSGGRRQGVKKSGGGIDFDVPSIGGGGSGGGGGGGLGGIVRGGGSFDGGGASGAWTESNAQQLVAAAMPQNSAGAASNAGSSVGKAAGDAAGNVFGGIDGDGLVLLLLALALAGTIFIVSGYVIWSGPDVLTEAAFGAALTGTLARPAHEHASGGWIAGVVRKTWWQFALVFAVAIAFACYAQFHFPEASTFRQAIAMAVGR